MATASRDLEILVAKIQALLAPDAVVLHDARLPGRLSGRQRQIDVLVKQQIGQYEMLIVLDCKDYAKPVDVKGVEEFHGLVEDVGAHRGVLVCPRGFSAAAKARAQGFQIDLYSPVDTDPHKWQVRASVPVLCDFRAAAISFGLSGSAPMPFRTSLDFPRTLVAYDKEHQELGTAVIAAVEKWNAGEYPDGVGEHRGLDIFPSREVFVDNGYGTLAPVVVTANLLVTKVLYFGNLSIAKISGFKDELSGNVIANAFTTGIFDPEDVVDNWEKIASEDDAPARPLLKLRGLVGWAA